MKIQKPIVKRPESKEELAKLKVEVDLQIRNITLKEATLKKEYSDLTLESNRKVEALKSQRREIEQKIKAEQSSLRRAQLDNRKERQQYADKRIRLKYDLKTLGSRFSSFLSSQRQKVAARPAIAFELLESEE